MNHVLFRISCFRLRRKLITSGFVLAAALAIITACATPKMSSLSMRTFQIHDWEKDIGYSQSVRAGNRIIVSGTVGDESKDLKGQLCDAYETIKTTLAHDGATLGMVAKETIFCRDMDALIACQEIRKQYYGDHLPAATWVQVNRLYSPGHLIEIEVEALLP